MELVVPPPIGDAIARVRELAARVFRAVDGSGLARCDFFVRDDGEVLVNEINTIPGFTATSVFWNCSRPPASRIPRCATASSSSRRAPRRERRFRISRFAFAASPNLRAPPCGFRSPGSLGGLGRVAASVGPGRAALGVRRSGEAV